MSKPKPTRIQASDFHIQTDDIGSEMSSRDEDLAALVAAGIDVEAARARMTILLDALEADAVARVEAQE